jgi:probable HAF family extracellular repeat protein
MRTTLICFAIFALLSGQAKAGPPTYSVTDLGPTSGTEELGISNTGQVLVDGVQLYWIDGTGWMRVLTLDSRLPQACGFTKPYFPLVTGGGGISHDGKIVVSIGGPEDFTATAPRCVAVFTPTEERGDEEDGEPRHASGTWTFKETLGYQDAANGINDAGQIIGNFGGTTGFGPGCNFSGQVLITASAINDSGQIAGTSSAGAELCTAGVWKVLPNVSGGLPGSMGANAINNKGEVVGFANMVSGVTHGFLYTAGKTIDLGTLPGLPFISAQSINIHGQIVGSANPATSAVSATSFLYQGGTMYDLAALISPTDPYKGQVQFTGTAVINDRGVIVALGTIFGGTELVLLTPTDSTEE